MRPAKRIVTAGLLETGACAAIALLVAWWTRSWTYLALWSLLGWTQMLRTPRSTALGLRWFAPVFVLVAPRLFYFGEKIDHWARAGRWWPSFGRARDEPAAKGTWIVEFVDEMPNLVKLLLPWTWILLAIYAILLSAAAILFLAAVIASAVGLAVYAAATRLVATLAASTAHPLRAMQAIPRNWRRVGQSLELFASLELVPRYGLFLRLRRATAPDTAATQMAVFNPWPSLAGARAALVSMGCIVAACLLAWPAVAAVRTDWPVGEKPWSIRPSAAMNFDLHSLLSEGAQGAPAPPTPQTPQPAATIQDSSAPEESAAKTAVDSPPVAEGGIEKLTEVDYLESFERAEAEMFVPPHGLKQPTLRDSVHKLPNAPSWAPIDSKAWEEGVGETLLYQRPMWGFSLFDPSDWIMWAHYLGTWPVRQYGEGRVTKFISTTQSLAILTFAIGAMAVYFGLWALVVLVALATPLRAVLFAPALVYRFSLKASALTYAPLFFVMEAPYEPYDRPIEVFTKLQEDAGPAVQRAVAKFLGLVIVANVVLAILVPSVKAQLPSELAPLFATWQHALTPTNVASAMVLTSTFAIWYLTKRALYLHAQGMPHSLGRTARIVRTLDRLKSMLAIYTVGCGIFWAATVLLPSLQYLRSPEFDWTFVPWNRH